MTEADAKRRLLRLGLVRLLGIVLAVAGVQIWRRGAFGFQDETGGKLIVILGVALMFLVPAMMRRHWRSRDGE